MLKKAYAKAKPVCKVTFSLPLEAAPDAETVSVLGDFNDWNAQEAPEMKKTKSHYEAALELAAGSRYEFRYLIDGKRWENDWDADGYVPSPFAGIANSVLVLDAVNVEAPAAKAAPATKAAAKTTEKTAAKAAPATKAAPAAKPAAKTTNKPAAKATPAAKTTTAKVAPAVKPAKAAKDNPKGGKK